MGSNTPVHLSSFPGILHQYTPKLVGFEFVSSSGKTASSCKDRPLLLFVGGLGDGLVTVPYVPKLVEPLDQLGWSVIQVHTQSSYIGWGTGSLVRDDEDLHNAVEFFAHLGGADYNSRKIVLMGHSTGSQNVLYYLSQSSLDNHLAAAIAQASVSDREGCYNTIGVDKTHELLAWVKKDYIDKGLGDDVLPRSKIAHVMGDTPVSANRFMDLVSVRGRDDFFSTDLTSDDFAKTFGSIKPITGTHNYSRLALFMSGKDEFLAKDVNREEVVQRFRQAIRPQTSNSDFSGVIPGATHNVGESSEPGALEWLIEHLVEVLKHL
ncbi:Alpha/Beta hydrolase fold, DUF1749 family protein [Schizosaccharomyces osmophilus]|uniref:Alpha/Beta hydrolase fold, DUF1749 family protein n=1 Tax=Schizosaccharomyces osmophilus TaxID=2545709 RepID=A0AAE9WB35_9SCHI|nr:Alpha/Beta hydrolase fold, DUF1749 family protein [Schizosaccharomyces osmophilus]WBW72915.1 Alpha/Beta hydrolase fold, DUF1749 family protein [Schizosaccharomyces osmophilus]